MKGELIARGAPQAGTREFRIGLGEAAGAVGDLGVLVPLVAALVLVNGLDPGSVLLLAGVLVVGSGVWFGIPFPVQPLKALTAVAVAHRLGPEVIHAAGLEIGLFLVLLSVRRVADLVARVFTRPVVRGLQFGVGALLVISAVNLVRDPPPVFMSTPPSPWPLVLGAGAFGAVAWAARAGRHVVALALLGGGVAAATLVAGPELPGPSLHLPAFEVPGPGALAAALFLLVVPQLPLTFGNAVVAVSDVSRQYFGTRGAGVSPSRVCLSAGAGNIASAVLGGMPMCHGSGGLTAHYRLGARTAGMNLLLGGAFLLAGLFFAPHVPLLLGLLPVWALAAFLAYAGLRHAFLVQDLDGGELALAVVAGILGALSGNLAVTAALGIVVVHGARWAPRRRARARSSGEGGQPG